MANSKPNLRAQRGHRFLNNLMHILLFHFHSDKPNPVYQEISAALRRRGHTVWVGAPNRHGDLEWKDGDTLVATIQGPMRTEKSVHEMRAAFPLARRWHYLRFMLRVRAFLVDHAPDIVQVNPTILSWVLTLGLPGKTHLVLDIRQINEAVDQRLTTRLKEQRDIRVMQANAHLFFDQTCFCHAGAARKILGPGWAHRAAVVPIGIDPQFLIQELPQSAQRNEAASLIVGASADLPVQGQPQLAGRVATASVRKHINATAKVRFIYVGTLSRLRNLDRLLAAARQVRMQSDRFQLDLIGPDHANGYYHELVEAWQIGDVAAVREPVPYDQVPALLQSYDVGLAYVPDRPTWHYQPAIKVMEYRALGMPILSTDVATHREVVEAGVNGLLVADTVESIAAAMQRFVTEPVFLQSCRANAQVMRRGTTWDEVAAMYEEKVYERLINGR